jgi:hypothetical protein
MLPTQKSRWTVRTLAVSLFFSLVLHALFMLALWVWPTPKHVPLLYSESTLFTVDTFVLDSSSVALGPDPALPEQVVPVLTSQLSEAPTLPQDSAEERGPTIMQDSPLRPSGGATEPSSHGTEASEGGSGSGTLFPLPPQVSSIVYVLDRSLTMAMDHKLDFARRELIAGLRRLPPSVRFQVIQYNDFAEPLQMDGCRDLLPAEVPIVEKAIAFVQTLDAAGSTNHLGALRLALDLHPDLVYFLTDADDLKPQEVALLTQRNRHSIVHTLELTRRREQPEGPLAQLARANNGTYRRVWMGEGSATTSPALRPE